MDNNKIVLPYLPAHIIKFITSFFIYAHDIHLTSFYILNIYKAFTFGIWNDDQKTQDYRENVQRHISQLVISDHQLYSSFNMVACNDFNLSYFELMLVFESMYSNHYTIMDEGIMIRLLYHYSTVEDSFITITDLLEDAGLHYHDEIMGDIHAPINCCFVKHINLLEIALLTKSAALLKFVRNSGYEPIMAFYLYVKYNHSSYCNSPYSLKCDDWLINLLMESECRNKFISLAENGTTERESSYYRNSIKREMIAPNLEVLKKIKIY